MAYLQFIFQCWLQDATGCGHVSPSTERPSDAEPIGARSAIPSPTCRRCLSHQAETRALPTDGARGRRAFDQNEAGVNAQLAQ